MPEVWTGCYEKGWGKFLGRGDAYAHPAKVAFGLSERIYAHLLERGYVQLGDLCLDPFAGIGGFAFGAMNAGLLFLGVELEAKFHAFANGWECPGNQGSETEWPVCAGCLKSRKKGVTVKPHHAEGTLEFWRRRWGLEGAVILQGDSRNLAALVGPVLADILVSSPPYADDVLCGEYRTPQKCREREERYLANHPELRGARPTYSDYGTAPGNLGNLKPGSLDAVISSPPYAETLKGDGSQTETAEESRAKRRTEGGSLGQSQRTAGYGSAGNLGNLPAGSVEAIVSSPPYACGEGHASLGHTRGGRGDFWGSRTTGVSRQDASYGQTPGQLGNLPAGEPPLADAIVGSPPYEGSLECHENAIANMQRRLLARGVTRQENGILRQRPGGCMSGYQDYTEAPGSLGNTTGETFWSAAKQIVAECHAREQKEKSK